MPYLLVNGHKLYYYSEVEHPDETAFPWALVLLVHGAAGTHRRWRKQIPALAQGFFTLAMDLPGHGLSDRWTGLVNIESYAKTVKGFWEEAKRQWPGLSRLVLVGHSMGGAIVLDYVLRYPEGVAGAVVMSSAARLRVAPEFLLALRQGSYPLDLITAAFGPHAPGSLVSQEREEVNRVEPDIRYLDFLACDAFDRTAEASGIRVPVFLIGGGQDRLVPPRYQYRLNEIIPGSRILIIEDAGHMVMLEQPAAVNDALSGFISSVLGSLRPVQDN